MKHQNLKEVSNEMVEFATKVLDDKGEVEAMVDIIFDKDGETTRGLMPLSHMMDLPNLPDILRSAFADMGVTQYVMITEAWSVRMKRENGQTFEDMRKAYGDITPSQSEDRIDTLIIAGMDNTGQRLFKMFEIKTDADGKRSIDKPETDVSWSPGQPGTHALEGRFCNLLDLPETIH